MERNPVAAYSFVNKNANLSRFFLEMTIDRSRSPHPPRYDSCCLSVGPGLCVSCISAQIPVPVISYPAARQFLTLIGCQRERMRSPSRTLELVFIVCPQSKRNLNGGRVCARRGIAEIEKRKKKKKPNHVSPSWHPLHLPVSARDRCHAGTGTAASPPPSGHVAETSGPTDNMTCRRRRFSVTSAVTSDIRAPSRDPHSCSGPPSPTTAVQFCAILTVPHSRMANHPETVDTRSIETPIPSIKIQSCHDNRVSIDDLFCIFFLPHSVFSHISINDPYSISGPLFHPLLRTDMSFLFFSFLQSSSINP